MTTVQVTLKVDGQELRAARGEWLLGALLREGVDVPHLCHHEAVTPYGACRLCLVEVRKGGRGRVATSCNYPAADGIEVLTQTERLRRLRAAVMELHLAHTPNAPRVRALAEKLGVAGTRFAVTDEKNDCILCGLCERVCSEIVGVSAISFTRRGGRKQLTTPFVEASQECIACGACVYVCPAGCIKMEQTSQRRVIDRWGRVLALQASEETGIPFAPAKQLEHFARLAGLPEGFYKAAPGERPPKHE